MLKQVQHDRIKQTIKTTGYFVNAEKKLEVLADMFYTNCL